MRGRATFASAVMLACTVASCASAPVNVSPTPPAQYRVLGPASGSACGYLAFGPYAFVPVGLNDRVKRAYTAAVASVPGAVALVNVTLQEDFAWYLLFTERCVTIKGEAIQ